MEAVEGMNTIDSIVVYASYRFAAGNILVVPEFQNEIVARAPTNSIFAACQWVRAEMLRISARTRASTASP